MLIRGDARSLPLVDGCVDCVVTSPPYFGLRDYGSAGQLGLESSPACYVTALVAVFREVGRVLKPEGTVWLNLGDSYASGGRTTRDPGQSKIHPAFVGAAYRDGLRPADPEGVKPKDLLMIPARVALALQVDGWYLRSDIIWHKPNPMPESVTDRPTKAHEYLFLLTKSERYFYDQDAIREPFSEAMLNQIADGYTGSGTKDYAAAGVQNPSDVKRRILERARGLSRHDMQAQNGRVVNAPESASGEWMRADDVFDLAVELDAPLNAHRASYRPGSASNMNEGEHVAKSDAGLPLNALGRNRRTVWTIPTMPYAGAHFATMPEALVEPCILAGCPLGGLVLDPFVGSGTVVAVAERLGRRGVGVDLSYQDLARTRTRQRGLSFVAASQRADGAA